VSGWPCEEGRGEGCATRCTLALLGGLCTGWDAWSAQQKERLAPRAGDVRGRRNLAPALCWARLGPPPPQLLPRPPPRLPIAYTVPLSIHQTQLLTCCSTNYHEAFRPRRQHCAWHQAHRYESHRARAARLHRPHDDVQDALGRAVLIRLSRIGRLASKVDIPQTGTRPFSVAHCITKP
jgi:hypothetical protein